MSKSDGYDKRVRWYVEQGVSLEVAEAIVRVEARGLGLGGDHEAIV